MKNNFLICILILFLSSCIEDKIESDFIGNYHFSVQKYSYSLVHSDTIFYFEHDTTFYEFDGSIEKYRNNRLLIKYSQSVPIGRCIYSVNSWSQGPIDSDFISNCSNSQLVYVGNWITPILFDNDSLKLFEDFSLRNGLGCFLNNDSISFELIENEKAHGFKEIISGIKLN